MQELLGALGPAWPRILFYPGGLTALSLALLITFGRRYLPIPSATLRTGSHPPNLQSPTSNLLVLTLQLGAITLLPLPYAVPFPYGLDLMTALVLLDGPGWLGEEQMPRKPLWPWLLFVLGGLAFAEGSGGWRLDGLLHWYGREMVSDRLLLIAGSLLWLGGAFSSGRGALRLVGHGMIAALPWL
jgi:hypothetical protein